MSTTTYENLIFLQEQNRNNLQNFFRNYKKDSADRKTKTYFEKRLLTLEEHFNKIKSIHADLLKTLYEDEETLSKEDYFKKNQFSDLENVYLQYYDTIQEDYNQKFPVILESPSPSGSPNSSIDQQAGPTSSKWHDFQLQKIQIPKFKGDYDSWLTFRDLFNASIHDTSMSNASKLWTLKSLLVDSAADLLADYTVSDGDYPSAWKMLNDRFNNTRVLVNNELKSFFDIANIKTENPNEIKNLYDKANKLVSRLRHLQIETTNWDAILVYILSQKLPKETHQLWEQTLTVKTAIPRFGDLKDFLLDRFRTLEAIARPNVVSSHASPRHNSSKVFSTKVKQKCCLCDQDHYLRLCPQFLAQSVESRLQFIKSKKGCINCLNLNHTVANCNSKFTCRQCNKKHHTMLHNNALGKGAKNQNTSAQTTTEKPKVNNTSGPSQPGSSFQSNNVHLSNPLVTPKRGVLLATALVSIVHNNQSYSLRALIDPGSEISLMLESVQKKLGLPTTAVSATISGMGGTQTAQSNKITCCMLMSRNQIEGIQLQALVLKRLTGFLPSQTVDKLNIAQLQDLELADNRFYKSQKIDLVLGADVYPQILKSGTLKFNDQKLVAQQTIFGWVVSGICQVQKSVQCSYTSCFNQAQPSIDDQIRKFWELEEIAAPKYLSESDKYCEELYESTTTRTEDGRYVVDLPFVKDYPDKTFLSHSRFIALNRFYSLEKRLHKDPTQHNLHDQNLLDYLKLGHMTKISSTEPNVMSSNKSQRTHNCYLPHHGVFKPSSTSTKLRVVFDASCKSINGKSLNDVLEVGPTLQQDLMSIILRWRKYPFVFNADIEKMYRQIWINPKHASFQRILYRSNNNQAVQDYQLNTVTFGVSSAPYLAIRTLLQLAKDEKHNFPVANRIVQNDFYVDDVLSGTYDLKTAIKAQHDLRSMLRSGGFELKKWSTNNTKILEGIPFEDRMPDPILNFDINPSQKTLGIYWNKKDDYFSFKISSTVIPDQLTKRQLFSAIARLFDPAGWLGPIVINAKILMQQVWGDKTEWDGNVNKERLRTWKIFMSDLPNIEKLQIQRYLNYNPDYDIEIHGFCDASEQAYGAVLYLKVTDQKGITQVNLIMAKTKVAPKNQDQLTIPRLELCGAVLLAKLLNSIKTIIDIPAAKLFAWSDSTIVLAWLKGSPCKWKTFVANRVATIIKSSENIQWHHVVSSDNPAHAASRGLMPSELLNMQQWWHGPAWLKLSPESWPLNSDENLVDTDLEAKPLKTLTNVINSNPLSDILARFSTLGRALRVLSYIKRFILRKFPGKFSYKTASSVAVTAEEMRDSLKIFVRASQRKFYFNEYEALTAKSTISNQSTLLPLNPFLDTQGIIRMNGRLSELSQNYDEKYPVILSPLAYLTKLLVQETHMITLHGGVYLMMAVIRKRYWIPKLKMVLKTNLNQCKTCIIQKKQTMSQLMGILPNERATVSLPFTNTGVDYAGPLTLKLYKGRCNKYTKGYIALFICFSTKAIHLEAVSDLSTKTFLEAFERFFSRRGLCQNIYSDNGTNFVGANTELTKQYKLAIKQATAKAADAVAKRQVNWHFIPPGAPHFGGIWEAGVKSVKNHLRKVVQKALLTYEELSTLLCRIEACLNSRPLTALSEDPTDLNPLTPGHFLRGEALLAPPSPSYESKDLNQLKRLELLQQLKNEFWSRWKVEYLSQLQQRPKWKQTRRNLQKGDLVVIKNENTAPQVWKLGRILDTHPGSDGLVRVVTVKTSEGEVKRPISKLCLLPLEKEATTASSQ